MVQMVLDLVILGLGVQVYRGAVSMGRKRSDKVTGSQTGETDMPGQKEGTSP
jgi:hypothetical protein